MTSAHDLSGHKWQVGQAKTATAGLIVANSQQVDDPTLLPTGLHGLLGAES